MASPDYDWVVVGAGAAGISIAEMLSRLGLKVLLLEKNEGLASETSRVFHEWLHTGSLYTLVPDNLKTTKYLLGAIDDLFEYYSGYGRMNMVGTMAGLSVKANGWFNDDHIYYRYRKRPFNPAWGLSVARARWLINKIDQHDWLRRRAGSIQDTFCFNPRAILKNYSNSGSGFLNIKSPDVTINSRSLLTDLLNTYEYAGNDIIMNCEVSAIIDRGRYVEVTGNGGKFRARHAVICCADGISQFTNTSVKTSYAPMFVVGNLHHDTQSFVELDFNAKACINLLNKKNGYGLAGGISVSKHEQIKPYLEYCVNLHTQRNPEIRVIDTYVGLKKELVMGGQDRNYLYHINEVSENIRGIVLGKFTLMFSLAPEFIRRFYKRNPPRVQAFGPTIGNSKHPLLSNTCWQDIVNKSEE
ncbi:FAD-dependent oxidoreductase [Alphaproteobacteria bacterium]|nr:FAD-dependent oxidoreductase [Alphaproteobacteria bacterium]